MNPEISSAIAALTSDPKVFEAIVAIYEQGRHDGIEEAGELAAILSTLPASFDLKVITFPIEVLDLSVRAYNILKNNGVSTLWNLIRTGESGLRGLRNFKDVDLEDVKTKLANYGLGLRAEA